MKKLLLVLALVLLAGCKDDKTPEPSDQASVLEISEDDILENAKKDESLEESDLDFIKTSLRLIRDEKIEEFSSSLSPELREGYGDLEGVKNSLRPFYEAGNLLAVEKIEKPGENTFTIITNHEKENLKISLTRDENGSIGSYQMTPYSFAMRQEDLYKKYPDLVDKTVDTINFVYADDYESFKNAFSDLGEEKIKEIYDTLKEETQKRGQPAETSYQFVDPPLTEPLATDKEDLVQLYFVISFKEGEDINLLVTFTEAKDLISLIYDPDIN